MTITYARVPHGSLIIKLYRGRMGIWDLQQSKWQRRPFTTDRMKAIQVLRKARIAKASRPERDRPSELAKLTAIVVFGLIYAYVILGVRF